MTKPLGGILFDKDGTFVDFEKTWGTATFEVIRHLSAGDPAAFDRIVDAMHYDVPGRRFRATSPLIAGAPDSYVHLWADALGRANDGAMLDELNRGFADETLRALAPIGRPASVMEALHGRGLKLGLATNDTEASGRAQVAALGLHGFLDFFAGYDSGHGAKPDAGMVLAFARAIGAAPEQIAMVGDSAHDMNAARAAGALAIAVLTGPATRQTLEPLADHVIAGIEDLPALIDTINPRYRL